ncbi:MAG: hypothetical protein M1281_00315 [Chloroflexi bacterium]|nr:hypothetical protein [Chloroflexota bacterium]
MVGVMVVVIVGAIFCALQSMRANRLLVSALWLAGTSALVALAIFVMGAPEVAVIELSVGAGLVTVLFVFAINVAGEEPIKLKPLVPRPLSIGLVALSILLLGWMGMPGLLSILQLNVTFSLPSAADFTRAFWEQRSLDVVAQIVLVFAGVLGVLGLLSDTETAGGSSEETQK